jgi:hypothetical protein
MHISIRHGHSLAVMDLHGEIAKLFVTWTEFADDSPLEETGFEPSVPRKAPAVVLVWVLVRADFSVSGESSEGDMSPSRNLACVTRYRRFESGFLQR